MEGIISGLVFNVAGHVDNNVNSASNKQSVVQCYHGLTDSSGCVVDSKSSCTIDCRGFINGEGAGQRNLFSSVNIVCSSLEFGGKLRLRHRGSICLIECGYCEATDHEGHYRKCRDETFAIFVHFHVCYHSNICSFHVSCNCCKPTIQRIIGPFHHRRIATYSCFHGTPIG